MAESLDNILEASLASSKISSPQDALVVAVHSALLAAGYSLVAIGDQDFGKGTSTDLAELSSSSNPGLPDGWNSSQDVYVLQYCHGQPKLLYLVKGILMEGQLLVNAMAACNMAEVITVTLDMAKYIKSGTAFNTPSVFKNLLQLMSVLNKELETKLSQMCSQSLTTVPPSSSLSSTIPDIHVARATRPRVDEGLGNDPLRVGPARRPGNDPLRIGPPRRPDRAADRDLNPLGTGPFGYGDTDRFPFVGGDQSRGGMIFDPLRQGGAAGGRFGPRGPFPPNHPQGARYDPVFPFGPGPHPPERLPGRGFGEPDPDHLPPPGYDDMFS